METITRKPYETDLTDDEWAIPEPILQRALYDNNTNTRAHPRHYPPREITNAILYVLKTGCQWRQLPHDLPPWKTVYYHFRRWEKRGVLEQIRDTLVQQARAHAGKDAPKHLAVDRQSVPSTAKGGRAAMIGARNSKGASGILWWTRTAVCLGYGSRLRMCRTRVGRVGCWSGCCVGIRRRGW